MRCLSICIAVLALAAAAVTHNAPTTGGAPTPPATLVNLEGTPEYEDVLSRSFEAILSDSQRVAYASLEEPERRSYRRRFWNWNDPTAATDENEFLDEHVGRLDFALALFCDDGTLEWDDRGEMVIRFGIPDSRIREMGDISLAYGAMGIIPDSETWIYGDEELTLHFIDPSLNGRYVLGMDTKSQSARGRPPTVSLKGDPDRQAPPMMPRSIEGEHAAYTGKRFDDKGLVAADEVPVSYAYAPPAEPLTFFYEAITFRGQGGRTDVAVNYEIPFAELSSERRGERRSAHVDKRVRVMDDRFEVLMTDERHLSVLTEGSDRQTMVTDEWRMDMNPGEFIVGLAVRDTATGRVGSGRSRIVVPDYDGPGLRMSDLLLASSVGDGVRFRRLGGSVVPRPSHAFRGEEDLVIYFELYGLTKDRPGESRFTVTMEVSGRGYAKDRGWFERLTSNLFPKKRHSVSSRVIGIGDVPDTAYWFALSLAELAEDNYDLTVTVQDVRSKEKLTRTAAFTVLN